MVGDGYLREKLEGYQTEGVRFFGKIGDKEKFDLLSRAHVLLVPSVREGWGISVIEANAMGTPAVGYDVPGLRDSILNGITGTLATPLSPSSLAKAAITLLCDTAKADKFSKSALDWSRKFTWDKAAMDFQHLLERYRNNN
jgi:glycosyltransferase involved in cell wall biosynthesis